MNGAEPKIFYLSQKHTDPCKNTQEEFWMLYTQILPLTSENVRSFISSLGKSQATAFKPRQPSDIPEITKYN